MHAFTKLHNMYLYSNSILQHLGTFNTYNYLLWIEGMLLGRSVVCNRF